MSSVKGSITKTKGKSKVRLAIGTKDKDKVKPAHWAEFKERLVKLADEYGIAVNSAPVAKKRASKK